MLLFGWKLSICSVSFRCCVLLNSSQYLDTNRDLYLHSRYLVMWPEMRVWIIYSYKYNSIIVQEVSPEERSHNYHSLLTALLHKSPLLKMVSDYSSAHSGEKRWEPWLSNLFFFLVPDSPRNSFSQITCKYPRNWNGRVRAACSLCN